MDTSESPSRWNPKWRKRKKIDGEDVEGTFKGRQAELTSIKDRGRLCRKCGKWRLWKQISFKYELDGDKFVRMIVCDVCDQVIAYDNPGATPDEEVYDVVIEHVRTDEGAVPVQHEQTQGTSQTGDEAAT